MDYNTGGGARPGLETILAAVGDETVNGIAKAPDVLTLQEQSASLGTTRQIVSLLNSIYGSGVYASGTLVGSTTGGDAPPGLIYNAQTIQVISATFASIASTSGGARRTLRYQLRPIGYDSTADFYVYVSHYKASNTDSDINRRDVEARQVRSNADALGQGVHIIYAGDFNVYTGDEPMFQTLLASGNGQAFDPISRVGDWSNNSSFRDVHTQSPATSSHYSGQVTGGMDDRFDFQLVSGEFLDNEGLSYISGSYRAFGNTNTHTYNQSITTGSAAALQARLPGYTLGQASAVLDALASVSDHLPVVADYQLPARMGVAVGSVPSRAIVGAAVQVSVTVSNTANVVAANGADELDYALSGSGAIRGNFSGTDAALGSGATHLLTLQTGTAGHLAGAVVADSSSQAAANPHFFQNVAYDVVDHASPYFAEAPNSDVFVLNFGNLDFGGSAAQLSFHIGNESATPGFTAGLDLDSIVVTGATPLLQSDLSPFANLAAGSQASFLFTFTPSQAGNFQTTYELHFSDENLPGASSLETLQIVVSANVGIVPEPAPVLLILLAGFVAFGWKFSAARRMGTLLLTGGVMLSLGGCAVVESFHRAQLRRVEERAAAETRRQALEKHAAFRAEKGWRGRIYRDAEADEAGHPGKCCP